MCFYYLSSRSPKVKRPRGWGNSLHPAICLLRRSSTRQAPAAAAHTYPASSSLLLYYPFTLTLLLLPSFSCSCVIIPLFLLLLTGCILFSSSVSPCLSSLTTPQLYFITCFLFLPTVAFFLLFLCHYPAVLTPFYWVYLVFFFTTCLLFFLVTSFFSFCFINPLLLQLFFLFCFHADNFFLFFLISFLDWSDLSRFD